MEKELIDTFRLIVTKKKEHSAFEIGGSSYVRRQVYLAYAFLRGKSYNKLERKILEDSFPYPGSKTFRHWLATAISREIFNREVELKNIPREERLALFNQKANSLRDEILAWMNKDREELVKPEESAA